MNLGLFARQKSNFFWSSSVHSLKEGTHITKFNNFPSLRATNVCLVVFVFHRSSITVVKVENYYSISFNQEFAFLVQLLS